MSGALQAVFQNQRSFGTVPGAPTIGTATATGVTTATVTYTAPASDGGFVITSYTATSSPSGITGTISQAGSGTITVSGLSGGTSYTFTVKATNALGESAASAASNSITTSVAPGQQAYITTGTFTFVAPAGVTSISVVAIGAGATAKDRYCCCGSFYSGPGGAGGGLGYKNNITVIPGNSYSVQVGEVSRTQNTTNSFFINVSTVKGGGTINNEPGTFTGNGGGNGGPVGGIGGGGGGAGGYSGAGGTGGGNGPGSDGTGGGGGGGGGGGYPGGGGGGVGILGQGSSGVGGVGGTTQNLKGTGGSGGANGVDGQANIGGIGGAGGSFGGGGGSDGASKTCNTHALGASGAVRIIYPGNARSFPSTRTADE